MKILALKFTNDSTIFLNFIFKLYAITWCKWDPKPKRKDSLPL